jgi:hypothetical protein
MVLSVSSSFCQESTGRGTAAVSTYNMCCLDPETLVALCGFLVGMVKCMPENLKLLVYLASCTKRRSASSNGVLVCTGCYQIVMTVAGTGRSGKARRKTHKGFPVTQLRQQVVEGLCEQINRYDPEGGLFARRGGLR